MSIKRYDPNFQCSGDRAEGEMEHDGDGEYVLFSDHEADKADQANDSHALWVKHVERITEIASALSGLLGHFEDLRDSGTLSDDSENDPQIIAAREALES